MNRKREISQMGKERNVWARKCVRMKKGENKTKNEKENDDKHKSQRVKHQKQEKPIIIALGFRYQEKIRTWFQ